MPRLIQKQFLYAAENGDFHQFHTILEQYGETEVRDYYWNTPLMLAARNGNTRIVKTLLDAGANIHNWNFECEDALVLAARETHPRMVRLLLGHGAHYGDGNIRALADLKPDNNYFLRINVRGDPKWGPWSSIKVQSKLRIQRIGLLMRKVVELLIAAGADVDAFDDEGYTPIYNFIQCGVLDDCVRLMLKNAHNLNTISSDGHTALTGAIMMQKEDIALLLLASGADPNIGEIVKPIHQVASSFLSPTFLKKLIEYGADVTIKDKYGTPTLYYTFKRRLDNQEITQILLDAGADTEIDDGNGFTISDHAMMAALELEDSIHYESGGCPDNCSPYQFPFNPSYARFIRAAKHADYDSLKSQLENPLPDRIKTLALHETLSLWKYECCRLLLDNGAPPDGIGINGTTPLTVAAFQLEIDIAGLLHSNGANLEQKNNWGQKPLYCACQGGIEDSPEDLPEERRFRMASLLLRRGADVEGADSEGMTPLCQAVFAVKDKELARLLLQHGANPDKRDELGITLLHFAERNCSYEMVELLREYLKR